MGLLVVARLASRHGVAVELRSASGGGTAALVALPINALAAVPAEQPEAGPGSVRYPARTPGHPAEWAGRPVVPPAPLPGPPAVVTLASRPANLPARAPAPAPPPMSAPVAVPAPSLHPVPAPGPSRNGGQSLNQDGGQGLNQDGGQGLPRRRPGSLLVAGQMTRPQPVAADDPTRPPDPDAIRARLSGLASGLAAAARHTTPRPPA
jgi:hypothetical protein